MSSQGKPITEVQFVQVPLDALEMMLNRLVENNMRKVVAEINDPWRNLPPQLTLSQAERFLRNALGLVTTHQTIRSRINDGRLHAVPDKSPLSIYTEDLKGAVEIGLFNAKKI